MKLENICYHKLIESDDMEVNFGRNLGCQSVKYSYSADF